MLSTRPNLPDIQGKRFVCRQIAWPHARVLNSRGKFAGFLMPEIDFAHSRPLESILQKNSRRLDKIDERYQLRVAVAANLSSVFAELHRLKHYMIDMKPDNLRLYPDGGFLAVVDTDGFSIRGIKRFPAQQFTDNYIAPEGFGRRPQAMGESQDRFALAVILFQLLNNGLHPFSGVVPSGHSVPSDLQSRIYANLYAYGFTEHPEIRPALASIHTSFDAATRQLFDRSFLGGGGGRPSAREWRDHLRRILGGGVLARCNVNPREHAHFGNGCGLCEWDKRVAAARGSAAVRRTAASPGRVAARAPPAQLGTRPPPRPTPPTPSPAGAPHIAGAGSYGAPAIGDRSYKEIGAGVMAVIAVLFVIRACVTTNGRRSVPVATPSSNAHNFTVSWFANAQRYIVTPRQGISTINLRSGPGGEYPVVGQLVRGAHVVGRGRTFDSSGVPWISASSGDGVNGFIAERLLQSSGEVSNSQTAASSDPSFSCAGRLSYVERAICDDMRLGSKDREVARSYREMIASASGAQREEAIAAQRSWIEERNRCGGSGDIAACLHDSYDGRAANLRTALALARQRPPAPQPFGGSPSRGTAEPAAPPPLTRNITQRSNQSQGVTPNSQPRAAPDTTPAVTCVLPSGQEVRISEAGCRARAGVIY
jgi:uncharacterized protein